LKTVETLFPDCPILLTYLRNMYESIYVFNTVGEETSAVHAQQIGIKQGCTLSPCSSTYL
jgi:hypothetical protein